MKEFMNDLYLLKKGVRDLSIRTTKTENRSEIEEILGKQNVSYLIQEVSEEKINVYFGIKIAIDVVEAMGTKPLNQYSAEEDFVLGMLLGYDLENQCMRYLDLKKK